MIGIAFRSHQPLKRVLRTVILATPLSQYYWKVPEYWIFSIGNGIDTDIYSPEGMVRCIDNLTEDEQAEMFTMFGALYEKNIIICHDMNDYLVGTNEAAFVCYDASWFEIYCKDKTALSSVGEVLLESDLCIDHKVDYITKENSFRTGF